jgi:hypothetical protein
MTEMILAVLLSLPPWHGDVETREEREARMRVVAQAIDTAAAGDRKLALLLVVLGESESHYARHIHEGQCRPWECDRGKSVSPWQIRSGPWLSHEAWEGMRGADLAATTRAAQYVARSLRHGLRACKSSMPSPLHGAFSVTARGGCGWPGAQRRVVRFRQLEQRWGRVAAPAE